MWFGPLNGTLRLATGRTAGVTMGMEFSPGTSDAEVSLTIDSLGQPAHLFYGDGFVKRSWGTQMKKAWSSMNWSQIGQTMKKLGFTPAQRDQ